MRLRTRGGGMRFVRDVMLSSRSEPVLALVGIALGFWALGLANAALDDERQREWVTTACIGTGVVLLIVGVVVFVVIAFWIAGQRGNASHIRELIRQAYEMRYWAIEGQPLVRPEDDELLKWLQTTQAWLNAQVPDLAPLFARQRAAHNGPPMPSQAEVDVAEMDARLDALHEIYRELRASM